MSDKCKETVFRQGGHFRGSACYRNAVKDGYCKQHHPDTVAQRGAESMARWRAEQAEDEAKWAQRQRQREDSERFAALCADPDLFHAAWRLWDGESDFRIAFDAAVKGDKARAKLATRP